MKTSYVLPVPADGMTPVYPVDTREAFDGFCAYVAAADEQPETGRIFADVLARLAPGAVILENGAGHGVRTRELVGGGFRVIACEPCADARDALARNLRETGLPVLVPGRGEDWRWPDGAAAAVLPCTVEDVELPPGMKVDLRLDRHLFYHVERSRWVPVLREAPRSLGENGLYWATLKSKGTSDNDMLEHFGLERFSLDEAIAEAYAGGSGYRVEKVTTKCRVRPRSFEHAAAVALFFLSDAAASGTSSSDPNWRERARAGIPWRDFLDFVDRNLWGGGDKEWNHDHDHFLVRSAA